MTRPGAWIISLMVAAASLGLPVPVNAQPGETVEYYGLDAVGSVRVVFSGSGTVLGRMDYGPFGEELFASSGVPKDRFAGLLRDGEAGLDYAKARAYQIRTGRFNAPDPVYGNVFEPQQWNRYSYALSSPLTFVDPTGLEPQCSLNSNGKVTCFWWEDVGKGQGGGGPFGGGFGGGGTGGDGGSASGGTGRASGNGGGGAPRGPNAPPGVPPIEPPVEPPITPPTEPLVKVKLKAFVKGCGEGAAIVADVANPFGDPFESGGYYDENTPGVGTSTALATVSVFLLDLVTGVRGLAEVTRLAPRGSALWKLNNNPRFRVGYSMWPRTQGRIPRLAFGTGEKTKYLDLRICGR